MQIIAHSDGRHRFVVEGPARHPFLIDAEHDGTPDMGPRPQELLLESLASCLGVTTLAVLEKKRLRCAGLIVHVDGQQNTERPLDYLAFTVQVEVAGADLTDTVLERAVELADRNCPVSRTLAKGVPIHTTSRVLSAEQLLERLAQAPAAALGAAVARTAGGAAVDAATPDPLESGLAAFAAGLTALRDRMARGDAGEAYVQTWQLQHAWMRVMATGGLRSQAVAADLTLLRGLLAEGAVGDPPGLQLELQGGEVAPVERLLGLEAAGVRFIAAGHEQLMPLARLAGISARHA